MQKDQLKQFTDIHQYVIEHGVKDTPLLKRLREETAKLPEFMMQIPATQGEFMAFLVKLTGAKIIIEIGVFTGYSSLCMASALPDDGKLIGLDTSVEWTAVARKYWREAGIENKIDLRIAPALESLESMIEQGASGSIDLIFLDADKEQYDSYYEQSLKLLKPNGLLIIDNVLLYGSVVDSERLDKDIASRLSIKSIEAIKALNEKVAKDSRVDVTMLDIADGISLVRKK